MGIEEEIQEAAENGELIVGTDETLKAAGSVQTIVIASNTPPGIEAEIMEAVEGEDVEVQHLDADSDTLGSLCMEPFSAAVVGIQ